MLVGYVIKDGVFYLDDWMKVIFNFFFLVCLLYMVMGVFIFMVMVIGGVLVWYLLKGCFVEKLCVMFKLVLVFFVIVILL